MAPGSAHEGGYVIIDHDSIPPYKNSINNSTKNLPLTQTIPIPIPNTPSNISNATADLRQVIVKPDGSAVDMSPAWVMVEKQLDARHQRPHDKGSDVVVTTTVAERLMEVQDVEDLVFWNSEEWRGMWAGRGIQLSCPTLHIKRLIAQNLCHKYNEDVVAIEVDKSIAELPQAIEDARREALLEILGAIGKGCVIERPFRVEFGFNTIVGEDFRAGPNLRIIDTGRVIIGDHVRIGANVTIVTTTVSTTDVESRRKGEVFGKRVLIGDDVCLGDGVMLLPGVRIGNGSVVWSGVVVGEDVPENTEVRGRQG
ncbi:hypothetical protein AJ80_09176 [Polytolypa hystricis UAMH7299]|uniref:Uncharacterized protein n=1 Tax=Polytolypa hystricis (strain UAMH7299) TaxID=1447883 RepID=A0A2B7WUY7_POLH7|nr:hypothetical protein AJ80_09176 [Polytolypa hystricis UAMH7299]